MLLGDAIFTNNWVFANGYMLRGYDTVDGRRTCGVVKPYFYISAEHFLYSELCNYRASVHLHEDFSNISA